MTQDGKSELSMMAQRLFHHYSSDGLDLAMSLLERSLDNLDKDFPERSTEEKSKMRQILKLECIARFCQTAENTAALSLAFKRTYPDERAEIQGVYDMLVNYEVGHVVDFYAHIANRNIEYVAKIMGYPPLGLQDPETRSYFAETSEQCRKEFAWVGEEYENLRRLYDAYKHGYRVQFGKHNNQDDMIAHVETDPKQGTTIEKVTVVSDDTLKRLMKLASLCREIIEAMFAHHRMRVMHEQFIGDEPMQVNYTIRTKKDVSPETKKNLKVMYSSRGERMKKDAEEADKIYEQFKEDLEKNHLGKIIAIDLDEKKVITMDYDPEKVLSAARAASSRIRIKRIGKNEKTGIETY